VSIISACGYKWQERNYNLQDSIAIARQNNLSEIIARILTARGIHSNAIQSFLNPTLRDLMPNPFELFDMQKAARLLADEIISQPQTPTIAIFGDYDVDGATSSALLVRYLRFFAIEPLVHIPDRIKEGYGPNAPSLLSLKEKGAKIVITVDCGTLAFEPIAAASAAGLQVIVIDHHKGDAVLPDAFAVVNPNRFDETSEHTMLAACGVTFLFMAAVNKLLKDAGVKTPDLLQFLDLVALGTICDVVPLEKANRAFVRQGLKIMASRANIGITTIIDKAKINEKPNSYHAGFIIGPRINAGGRVGKSDLGIRLLATEDQAEAQAIAEELEQFNAERKAIEFSVQEEAMQDADALPKSDGIIIVARQGWHQGVIGVVAGRLKEHFHKPVAVIALKDGVGKASARSITGVDLGAAVIAANHSGLLLDGGGHAMAAGFSIEENKIPLLREFINHRIANQVAEINQERILYIDANISLTGLNVEFVRLLEQIGPFGAGNPQIRLALGNIRIVKSDIMGSEHVRAIAVDAGASGSNNNLKLVAFRSVGTPLGNMLLNSHGKILCVAGHAKINSWQGRESVDFFVDDVKFS